MINNGNHIKILDILADCYLFLLARRRRRQPETTASQTRSPDCDAVETTEHKKSGD